MRGDARALRAAPGARAGRGDQHARSRCDRAGRGPVEPAAALCARATTLARARVLGRGGHAARGPCARRFERRARRGVAVGESGMIRTLPLALAALLTTCAAFAAPAPAVPAG